MTVLGILLFSFMILADGVGVWVGMQIKKPKVVIKKKGKDDQQYNDWKNKVSSLGRR